MNMHKTMSHGLELEAIIHTLNMWRNYIPSRRFVLMSDHSGLRYLFYQLNLNANQAIWFDSLNKFDLNIRYIKGKENMVADAIRRKVQLNHLVVVVSHP